jgi:hypothetical protein
MFPSTAAYVLTSDTTLYTIKKKTITKVNKNFDQLFLVYPFFVLLIKRLYNLNRLSKYIEL